MGKHTTAVFSGTIPPAINFLEPEKTFEDNADSLRDFIISLDKEKADRLRYKVEGDLVKVFITPYKTKITSDDLTFEEGDFNVEIVIAIGVENKSELDEAIAAHGRIFHDAVVATLNIAPGKDGLGTISWQDAKRSSFAEMVSDLADDLGGKDKPLIDEQIATALLTGVVSATDQFRNDKTSPSVMTLAANLMAKGANQQLIASELSAATETTDAALTTIDGPTADTPSSSQGEMSIGHDETDESAALPEAEATINSTPESNKINQEVEVENDKLAAERSQDALSAVESQLDNLAAQANTAAGALDDLRSTVDNSVTEAGAGDGGGGTSANVETVPQTDSAPTEVVPPSATVAGLSHGTPYAASPTEVPLNSALTSEESPSVDPFATPDLPPALDSTKTIPDKPIAPPVAVASESTPSNGAPSAATSFDLPLPPPPPLPPMPTPGQMPTIDNSIASLSPLPTTTDNSVPYETNLTSPVVSNQTAPPAGLPPPPPPNNVQGPTVSAPPVVENAPPLPAVQPTEPTADDTTQFRIPGQ
jgi:hypothetical protein